METSLYPTGLYLLEFVEPPTMMSSWQANDALFDRYYLSGIAPEFAIMVAAQLELNTGIRT